MSVSGKFLTAKIGTATIVGVTEWNAEEDPDVLDATVGGPGYTDTDTGPGDVRVTMTVLIDTTTGQYAPVRAQTLITNLKLYRIVTDTTPAFTLPAAIVTRSSQRAAARGRVEATIECKNKGVYSAAEPGT